jgi:hypothetical protein
MATCDVTDITGSGRFHFNLQSLVSDIDEKYD